MAWAGVMEVMTEVQGHWTCERLLEQPEMQSRLASSREHEISSNTTRVRPGSHVREQKTKAKPVEKVIQVSLATTDWWQARVTKPLDSMPSTVTTD